jgi:chemosensory pili system protein ChpA (sensor histidine kinase/response regulator)
MSQPLDPEVLRGFLEEARSYVPGMQRCLEALKHVPSDGVATEELFRLAHSLSGASRVIGIPELGDVAHGLEQLLEPALSADMALDAGVCELLETGVAQISAVLSAAEIPAAEAPDLPEPQLEKIPADLLESFLQEAEESLQAVGGLLRSPSGTADQKPALREIRRGIHTIKGAAGMVGLETLSRIAHRMEDLLDLLFDGAIEHTEEHYQLLVATYDLLCDLVRRKGRVGPLAAALHGLLEAYDIALGAAQGPAEPARLVRDPAPGAEGVPAPAAEPEMLDASRVLRVPPEKLDDLVRLVGELFVNRSAFERHLAAYVREVEELTLSLHRARRLATQFDAEHVEFAPAPAGAGPSPAPPRYGAEFDELEFDRYGQLHLLARELNETTTDVSTAATQLKQLIGGFESYLAMQGRLTSEVQEKLVRLRMVPLAILANRMHRTVRVASQKSGKQAELVVEGLAAELDKSVVEQLAGPVDHLLRNAVDHGIEAPEERLAAGKPEMGRIHVRAAQRGTEVVIRISDNGAGIDPERLRQAAVRLGFLDEKEALQTSREALFALVFEPGFSTASAVSEISGRGVGLDVVKAAVEALKGSVSLESAPGKGTTFTLRMPTTLAITRVLFVEEQQETYAVPLSSVVQVVTVEASQFENVGGKPVVRLGQKLIPMLRLAELLQMPHPAAPVRGRQPMVVLRAGEEMFGLALDRIAGAREVMVKPLSGLLRRSSALAGATLLGDGSVVLILNPAALSPSHQQAQRSRGAVVARPLAAQRRPLNVLIVDDSLSVRRVVANLMKNNGWIPIQAKDGLEALELLQRGEDKPDVILMDIEMPRMDGFELTATLRSQPEFRATPIVMLTSRAGEKHRSKAFSLGATHYVVKPYQDETLLSIIRSSAEKGRQAGRVA